MNYSELVAIVVALGIGQAVCLSIILFLFLSIRDVVDRQDLYEDRQRTKIFSDLNEKLKVSTGRLGVALAEYERVHGLDAPAQTASINKL